MSIQALIEEKLQTEFNPQQLEVTNESFMHNVPPGSETHFKVVLVSEAFSGKRPVARHQAVYKTLADELAGPVHALALHTYTGAEWQEVEQASPDSPQCRGGSKQH